MFGRKKQVDSEQSREARQVVRPESSAKPAFSYYTNRVPEASKQRMERQDRGDRPETKQSRGGSHSWFSQLPFWLLLSVLAVCTLKILWLSTNPKVVVLDKNDISATYLQSTEVYAAASHKLLASSITNYTKLTVNLGGTAKALRQQFPELQNVSLGVPLIGSRPIVYVQVAQPSLILQTAYGNFALNDSGVVLAKLQTVPAHVTLVLDQSGVRPEVGKRFLPGSTVTFTAAVVYQFAAAQLGINTFVLPAHTPYELDVRLSGQQYIIRMNLEEDARIQSGVVVATVQQLGSSVPSQYLDVRTPGRVYYK